VLDLAWLRLGPWHSLRPERNWRAYSCFIASIAI
jgi:hypothetical protein